MSLFLKSICVWLLTIGRRLYFMWVSWAQATESLHQQIFCSEQRKSKKPEVRQNVKCYWQCQFGMLSSARSGAFNLWTFFKQGGFGGLRDFLLSQCLCSVKYGAKIQFQIERSMVSKMVWFNATYAEYAKTKRGAYPGCLISHRLVMLLSTGWRMAEGWRLALK